MRALVALLSTLFAVTAFASEQNASWQGPTSTASPHPRKVQPHYTISGSCSLRIARDTNAATACEGMVVVLKDKTGREMERTRTDSEGNFRFDVDAGMSYSVQVPARAYEEKIEPDRPLKAGDESTITLIPAK